MSDLRPRPNHAQAEQDLLVQDSVAAYELLFELENVLRELVIHRMSEECGSQWFKQRLPGQLRQTADDGKHYEGSQPWRTCRIYYPIYYLDFQDLKAIIDQRNNWTDVFAQDFHRKDLCISTLPAVEPTRNRVAHTRPCLPSDGSGAVVKGRLPRWTPLRPSSDISRSTVQRAIWWRSRWRWSQTRRAPHTW